MTAKTVYVVQAFEMYRKRLVPTIREQAKDEAAARRSCESVARRKGGAAVLRIDVDDETGAVERAQVLETLGDVPDDLDQLTEAL